jgi:hypothetical protein
MAGKMKDELLHDHNKDGVDQEQCLPKYRLAIEAITVMILDFFLRQPDSVA